MTRTNAIRKDLAPYCVVVLQDFTALPTTVSGYGAVAKRGGEEIEKCDNERLDPDFAFNEILRTYAKTLVPIQPKVTLPVRV